MANEKINSLCFSLLKAQAQQQSLQVHPSTDSANCPPTIRCLKLKNG